MNKASAVCLLKDVLAGRVDGPALFDREHTTVACIDAGYLVWNEYREPVVTAAGKAFVEQAVARSRATARARAAALRAFGLRRTKDGWQ